MSKNYDKAINRLLEEFLRVFEGKGFGEELMYSAKMHLAGTPVPNPIGFVVEVHQAVSDLLNVEGLCETMEKIVLAEAKQEISSLSAPLQLFFQEAIFIVECEKIRKMAIAAFSSSDS